MEPRLPAPPRGCSPTLGVRRTADPKERLPILGIVLLAFASVAVWEFGRGELSWLWALVIFGTAYALVAAAVLRGEVSCGREWVRRVAPLGTAWVRTDRLVEAAVEVEVTGTRVSLRDADGRRLHARIEELAEAPEVWQALHAALRASLATGYLRLDVRSRAMFGFGGETPGASRD